MNAVKPAWLRTTRMVRLTQVTGGEYDSDTRRRHVYVNPAHVQYVVTQDPPLVSGVRCTVVFSSYSLNVLEDAESVADLLFPAETQP